MPIHLIWGDDSTAIERETKRLVETIVDSSWASINLSRLDGADLGQAKQALEEARTPAFGSGGRLIIVKRSPFCNNCTVEISHLFEDSLDLIPDNSHLVLINSSKPDGRLKSTKVLRKLIKFNQCLEKSFLLPAFWDQQSQKEYINKMADELGLSLEENAAVSLVEAIGNDSSRLRSELEKLTLYASIGNESNQDSKELKITNEMVNLLIDGVSTNSLKVGDSLLSNDWGEALERLDTLIDSGEPALRILATLIGQVRGWLWITLLEETGERDVAIIAKAAGIANPKRIYILRKQIQGKPPSHFLMLLSNLLDIETAIKRGGGAKDAFKDALVKKIT